MKLLDAMGTIADVQVALLEAGYQCGNWGPCGDGVDGRWGDDSQAALGAYRLASGLTPAQTGEALTALGIAYDQMTFQTAVNAWNQWRNTQIPGSQVYEDAANAMLAEATGITPESCPADMVISKDDVEKYMPGPRGGTLAEDGTTDLASNGTTKAGVPWWIWLIAGLMAAGAIGGGIWYWTQWKKRKRRKSSGHKGMNGYGRSGAGAEITDEEFSSEQIEYGKDDEQDDDEVS